MSHATIPLVKICGQTRLDDAQACAAVGADWLGFIFYDKSKRAVTFDAIAPWLEQVPRSVKRVAVFVDASEAEVRRIMESGLLDLAQFHGREPATTLNQYRFPWIKAIRLHETADLDQLDDFHTDLILLDGPDPGSGRVFDWDLAHSATKKYPQKKFILAGGLTPQNVAAAVEKIQPYAVDVASGVESAPGQKNLALVTTFVQTAKNQP